MAESDRVCGVSKEEAERYSRQILVSEVGVSGFRKIADAAVLVVGAGGLGSPAALYLVGAGVKCLGIVDGDNVETTNLHRQVIHSEDRVGVNKAASAAKSCRALNQKVPVVTHEEFLNENNALNIMSQYDVIVDATDNVVTRYLLNDACVLLGKPLVSGSALRMEGQLTVYSYGGGPCYRCIFPQPPPAHTVTNCSDGGVIGPVPGVIGTLQVCNMLCSTVLNAVFAYLCECSARLTYVPILLLSRPWRLSRSRWARARTRSSSAGCCSTTPAPAASAP
jgi:adenylyltransferase/sulfurtransferase